MHVQSAKEHEWRKWQANYRALLCPTNASIREELRGYGRGEGIHQRPENKTDCSVLSLGFYTSGAGRLNSTESHV